MTDTADRPGAEKGQALSAAKLLAVVGVVYGDIGTSPLYTLRECFEHAGGPALTPHAVYGVLSLIFWAMTLIITVKYVSVIMRADNRGEGGVLALTALALRAIGAHRGRAAIIALGMVGAALFLGDGIITPAISVLSAIEGLEVGAPALADWVIPLTLIVLTLLFVMQSRGTHKVGRLFGPITVLWFTTIGILGLVEIAQRPGILRALWPGYALDLFIQQPLAALIVMGSVVLAVTGGEALYADMGHFGRKPIRIMWGAFVWPALLLNYFGQGALLLADPEAIDNPFYRLAPHWFLWPLVVLATLATVIASQAVISGAFSLCQQAVQLGYLPRLQILHTSAEEKGAVYIPRVNWTLYVAIVALVLGFGSSSNLAGAYGLAVTGTMLVDTMLVFIVMRFLWKWPAALALPLFALFFVVDLTFLGATSLKILDGGWFPLVVGAGMWTLMWVWRKGRSVLFNRRYRDAIPLKTFVEARMYKRANRVAGTAIFTTSNVDMVPFALLHNLKHNKILHERVVMLNVQTADVPYIDDAERVAVTSLQDGFHTLVAHYGFQEQPDIPRALRLARDRGMAFDMADTSFFMSREFFIPSSRPEMRRWQEWIFILLSNNALSATEFFRIPANRAVELGSHIEI
jgi:KUP system potassium uptake protein